MKNAVSTDKASIQIGLDAAPRERVAALLSKQLADQHVLYLKTRNYHWNVQGMHFQELHAFFQEQYTQLERQIDDLAERIRSLGFFAPGSMEYYLENTRLKETNDLEGNATKMLQHLLLDHEAIIQVLRNDVAETEELGDAGTNDFLTGLMEAHEKMAWMIRAHLG